MMATSEQIDQIADACAKAQADLENIGKSGKNPHFHSSYVTLPDVLAEVRAKYAKHGVAIWQFPINGEGTSIGVVTRLAHSSGQWIESTLYVAPTKFDAQGAGSVITYLRRYALMAMAGVSGDDDDGNAAIASPNVRTRPNGHAAAPLPTSTPPPPPHNPETGEVEPHTIALTSVGDGHDWITWGRLLIAGFKSAASSAEITAWQEKNLSNIEECEKRAPKVHRSVIAAFQAAWNESLRPMLSEDEAETVLRGE